jgi:transcription factor E
MQVKLLHDLVEEMAGEGTGRIVEILFKKRDVNEFLIAKKMELTINQVRNILYKLSADNLVSFIRKKDKRKGWYIYYWTLNTEKCLAKLEGSLASKIASLEGSLNSRETKRFYICRSCEIEVGEEKALEHGFSCEECADIYELSDNSGPIREVKTKITRIKKNLALIQGELVMVRNRLKIARKRIINKLDREKKARTELMKKARAAARKKVADAKKKAVKKVIAKRKKVVKKVVAKRKKVVAKKKKVVKKVVAKKKKVVKKVSLASKLKKKLSGRR